MDKQELLEKIARLEEAAKSMGEPDKTFILSDISMLKMAIEGMAISDIAQKMQSMELPKVEEMNKGIQRATDAVTAQSERVSAFNKVFGFIKVALGLAV